MAVRQESGDAPSTRSTRRMRPAFLFLLAVAAALLAVRFVRDPRAFGTLKGDEATYISMALSAAYDGDLRYQPEDYERFVGLYGHGPKGIFLKRRYELTLAGWRPVPAERSLAFGKAFAYPLVAAPFVRVGGVGGLVVLNWTLLGVCLWSAATFGRRRAGLAGAVFALAFFGASVTPVYAAFLTPELFNVTLVTVACFLWAYKKVASPDDGSLWVRPWTTTAAVLLIGVATYSKATNAILFLPLAIDALVSRRLRTMAATALAFFVGSAGLFGVNALVSGEANYQGASSPTDRRSFYDHYPFDAEGTAFESKGSAMVTNDADTERVLATDELRQFPMNAWFFLVGRHAGFVPFYFPGAVLVAMWISRRGGRPLWQWTTMLAVAGAVAAFLVFFPDSWNGGGGPPGNRYFLSLYPALLLLLPGTLGPLSTFVTVAGGLAFTGAMVLHPSKAASETWRNVERAPLRWLPVELTLINDLPVRLHGQRGPVMFIREPTVFFYYLDGNTYYAEGDGLWIAGHESTDFIIRPEFPLRQLRLEFSAPIENVVTGTFGGRRFRTSVGPDRVSILVIDQPERFRYHQSYPYVLHLSTTEGFTPKQFDPRATDTRNLGVFLRPSFVYEKRE